MRGLALVLLAGNSAYLGEIATFGPQKAVSYDGGGPAESFVMR